MTGLNKETREIREKSILNLPVGWGNTPEEFKIKIIQIIKQNLLWTRAQPYTITEPNGSKTPFYPIFCAASPEWGIITKEEIYDILRPKFVEKVWGAYLSATKGYMGHIWDDEYIAWGLKEGIFSDIEIQKICSLHGDTSESYIQEHENPNLFEEILGNAFNELIFSSSPIQAIREKTTKWVGDCFDGCCCA